ncbi:type I restriction enzyme, S subunit [Sanguibacter gelidistatuariae]|uniref:Type I restriction enzyme, S subunit n=1 Tax=Sanguibacter gelidistatuariae TaxID=1814289 RepID=A0A1G6L805_9MICO|nr:restriction endonuclease subunit S [Sanguibacter gelidistatuariae]SDC39331.1 type I restriction enzyme, S subunit [Sanguibacter gelidistatuariae]
MGEWRETTLGEICSQGGGGIQTGPFGSQLHASDYVLDGIPSVMPKNIGDNIIIEDDIARIAPHDAQRLSKYLLSVGDIIYSRRGDVEKRALVRPEHEGWLCGTGCLRVRFGSESDSDPRFVSYLLGTEEVRAWIVRHAVGATMPNLNTSILNDTPLTIPEIGEQRAIAEVLGALDDKIAANTTLASTADELVRAWYGKVSTTTDATTTVATLATRSRTPAAPSELTDNVAYVGLEHVPRRQMWLDDSGTAASVTSTKTRFAKGDVLFGKLRPYFHKVTSAPFDGVSSTDILAVRASDTRLSGFVLAALSSDAVVERCTAASEGTRMPRTSWTTLSSIEVPWPGEQAARAMSQRIDAVRDHVEAALAENRTLAATRDTLLPALMSGALRVRDAERVVESAL